MDRLKQLPASSIFLGGAVLLYGLFGSPTPDNPGLVEGVIGVLLILSILMSGFAGIIDLGLERPLFLRSLQILFLSGLVLPALSAVYYGNDMMLILRDVMAFAFLGLPLFLSEKIAAREDAVKFLTGLLVFAGIAFAIRTLVPAFNIWIAPDELLYLSNSPLSLFAGVFLAGIFWQGLQRRTVLMAFGCFCALAVLCAAMLLDVQRATVGAIFLTILILAAFSFIEMPRRAFLPILVLVTLAAVLYPLANDALQAMAQKTASVGMNMRTQEAMAVFEALSASPETLFIGRGWGSVFASPAVAGLDVNYTHSFLTTMALKGGLVLLGLAAFTVLAALYEIFLIFQRDRVRGLALFWPLIVPVFLYASHKSLDFGLLLLLIGVWSTRLRTLRAAPASVKTEGHL